MTEGPRRRFVEGGFAVLLSMGIGLVADLTGFPWFALLSVPVLLLVRPLRRSLATHEFFVVASVVAALSIATMTLVGDPAVWTSLWFVSLLGTGALSSLVCLAVHLRHRHGSDAVAYTLIHIALPVILVGAGMKSLWKTEGMLLLHEGETSSLLHLTQAGFFTGKTAELPFSARLDRFQVEFYPKRVRMHLFDRTDPNHPIGTLDMLPGQSLSIAGMQMVAVGIEQQERKPEEIHQGMEFLFVTLDLNGTLVEFPLAALTQQRTIPFPSGDRVLVNDLLNEAAAKKAEEGTVQQAPPRPSPFYLAFTMPPGAFDPARLAIELHRFPESSEALKAVPMQAGQKLKSPDGALALAVVGTRKGPMEMDAMGDQPALLSTAHFTLDGRPVFFPVGISGPSQERDLPVGREATLAQMVQIT